MHICIHDTLASVYIYLIYYSIHVIHEVYIVVECLESKSFYVIGQRIMALKEVKRSLQCLLFSQIVHIQTVHASEDVL